MSVGTTADGFVWFWLWAAVVIRAATVLDERGNRIAIRCFGGFLVLLLLVALVFTPWPR
ncbi:hypothetical protein [Kibdelosporangium aridum]|uniref:Uncharacterized protein n=1 Tax=Kibdelosporangium aridum TaxID=2030 RepID=A0A1Y5XMS0_KIBAR|nr:hypothetical protein [Kibdelosporangium aridum]SMD06850.1 hypothetical protein SAMN05661093_04146 [Kibdelosporangium aridum]